MEPLKTPGDLRLDVAEVRLEVGNVKAAASSYQSAMLHGDGSEEIGRENADTGIYFRVKFDQRLFKPGRPEYSHEGNKTGKTNGGTNCVRPRNKGP